MMKQVMNFRLSAQAVTMLVALEKMLHTSKTAVVEAALRSYAKKKMHPHSALLEFSGKLNEKEADEMLANIQNNKHNKEMETKL